MITEAIQVGDEIVLQANPWQRQVVKVGRIAGIGLWVTECGMYFERGDVVEMLKKRPEPINISWFKILRNVIILTAAGAIVIGMYYNGHG